MNVRPAAPRRPSPRRARRPARHSPEPSPTRWTPKRPRSGIVPAFVTASRRAPVRPRMTRRCSPRRSAGAARRTRRRDSGRRACRARSRAAAARGRRRVGAADEAVQRRHLDLLLGDDRDDLLREHVEWVARDLRLLDAAAGASPWRRRPTRAGRRGTSGRCALRGRAELVAGAADPRCSPRATDFGLSTWITRSTAPMSMPSSRLDVATRQGSARLQVLLDHDPLLPSQRPVVRARPPPRPAR